MIKKSVRKQILDSYCGTKDSPESQDRLIKTLDLVNKCISECVMIPDGFHRCPRCKSKTTIRFDPNDSFCFDGTVDDASYYLQVCMKCKGTGYVDFVSNVVKYPEDDSIAGFGIPVYSTSWSKSFLASTILYHVFFSQPRFQGEISFDFDAGKKTKRVSKVMELFVPYKNDRDARVAFCDQHFDDLQKQVVQQTKVTRAPNRKIICSRCNSQPINLTWNNYEDEIIVKLCGQCYGTGYQNKKDTKGISDIGFFVNNADYHDKGKMLNAILDTAVKESDRLVFNVEFEENPRKAVMKSLKRVGISIEKNR